MTTFVNQKRSIIIAFLSFNFGGGCSVSNLRALTETRLWAICAVKRSIAFIIHSDRQLSLYLSVCLGVSISTLLTFPRFINLLIQFSLSYIFLCPSFSFIGTLSFYGNLLGLLDLHPRTSNPLLRPPIIAPQKDWSNNLN